MSTQSAPSTPGHKRSISALRRERRKRVTLLKKAEAAQQALSGEASPNEAESVEKKLPWRGWGQPREMRTEGDGEDSRDEEDQRWLDPDSALSYGSLSCGSTSVTNYDDSFALPVAIDDDFVEKVKTSLAFPEVERTRMFNRVNDDGSESDTSMHSDGETDLSRHIPISLPRRFHGVLIDAKTIGPCTEDDPVWHDAGLPASLPIDDSSFGTHFVSRRGVKLDPLVHSHVRFSVVLVDMSASTSTTATKTAATGQEGGSGDDSDDDSSPTNGFAGDDDAASLAAWVSRRVRYQATAVRLVAGRRPSTRLASDTAWLPTAGPAPKPPMDPVPLDTLDAPILTGIVSSRPFRSLSVNVFDVATANGDRLPNVQLFFDFDPAFDRAFLSRNFPIFRAGTKVQFIEGMESLAQPVDDTVTHAYVQSGPPALPPATASSAAPASSPVLSTTTTVVHSSTTRLQDLPPPILHHICTFVRDGDSLCHAACTCSALRDAADPSDSLLWLNAIAARWPRTASHVRSTNITTASSVPHTHFLALSKLARELHATVRSAVMRYEVHDRLDEQLSLLFTASTHLTRRFLDHQQQLSINILLDGDHDHHPDASRAAVYLQHTVARALLEIQHILATVPVAAAAWPHGEPHWIASLCDALIDTRRTVQTTTIHTLLGPSLIDSNLRALLVRVVSKFFQTRSAVLNLNL